MTQSPSMQAVVFNGLVGWLHQPVEGALRSTGVVLCDALGRDGRCGRLAMRLLAEGLAAKGFAVLRYDHRGEGESLDRPLNEDALPIWRADARTATTYLRELCGVRQIVMGGLRSGATLAALFADQADGLLLLGPVTRGAGWLREMQVAAKVLANAGTEAQGGVFDAEGLELNAASQASIGAINLKELPAAPAQVFLAAQNSAVGGLAASLQALGAQVELTDFAGFEALFEDAAVNHPPLDMIALATAWLERTFPATDGKPPVMVATADLAFPGGVETPVTFGPGLRGVLCRPTRGGNGECVVFTNTGGDPRAGIGRFAVKAGRDLVQQGVASFRFDFTGIADSPEPAGLPRSHIYEAPRQAEFTAVVQFLRLQGIRHLTLAGVCAGAHHALHAMAAGVEIDAVFAVNPIVLTWNPADRLEQKNRDLGRAARAYRADMFKAKTWARVLRGEVDVKAISGTLARRLLARFKAKRAGQAEQALKEAWAAHPGRLRFLLGTDDPALDNIEAHFGPSGRRLTAHPRISLLIQPDLDHGLSRAHSRWIATLELVRFIQENRRSAPDGVAEPLQHRERGGLGTQVAAERQRPDGLTISPRT